MSTTPADREAGAEETTRAAALRISQRSRQRENMRSLLLVLVSFLCLQGSQPEKVPVENRTLLGDYSHLLDFDEGPSNVRSQAGLTLRHNSSIAYLRGPLSTKVIPVTYVLVLSVGVLANVAILGSLLKKIRTVSCSILYSSLAVSDLLLLLSLALKVHYHLHGNHWVFGETACRMVTACFYGNLYCSAQMLACISVTRYLAVVRPFTYRSLPQKPFTALLCGVSWALFVAAAVPELMVQQTHLVHQLGVVTCHDVLPLDSDAYAFRLPYNIVMGVLGLLLPLLVTAVCYNRILAELNRSHLDWGRYIKASALVLAIFLLCFAPAAVLHLLHYARLTAALADSFYAWFTAAACLCCLHACLDPFLFLLLSHSTSQFFGIQKKTLNTSETI